MQSPEGERSKTLSPREHEEGTKTHSVTVALDWTLSGALCKSTISQPNPNFSILCSSKQSLRPVNFQEFGPGGNEQRTSSLEITRIM